jgi:hypothetical protein
VAVGDAVARCVCGGAAGRRTGVAGGLHARLALLVCELPLLRDEGGERRHRELRTTLQQVVARVGVEAADGALLACAEDGAAHLQHRRHGVQSSSVCGGSTGWRGRRHGALGGVWACQYTLGCVRRVGSVHASLVEKSGWRPMFGLGLGLGVGRAYIIG